MPDYSDGKVSLTEAEKAIVEGMNWGAANRLGCHNIGAVHFDGPVLRDVLMMHREITDRLRK